jgi:acetyl esterase/lipase
MKANSCKLVVFLILTLQCQILPAQERFRNEITDSVKVDTYTYAFKDAQSLDLDVYTPAFDQVINRPLIIYIHGGGFYQGTRNSTEIQEYCKNLARYGYVVSSISYRLTRKEQATGFGCDCPAVDKLNTFNEAVEDLQDATYFLINHREKLGIDPQKIILSGSSAGAETALNTAYQPPYCYGLESGPVSYAGVIAMAGAIPDTTRIYAESAVPSLLFHGSCDHTVPYETAPHRYCKKGQNGYLVLHGSKTIAAKLKKLKTPYWLYTYCNADHEISGTPMQKNIPDIIDFCYSFILKKSDEQRITDIKTDHQSCNLPNSNSCNE